MRWFRDHPHRVLACRIPVLGLELCIGLHFSLFLRIPESSGKLLCYNEFVKLLSW
jgi:hypothetical protein